jgi:hypothetical protein
MKLLKNTPIKIRKKKKMAAPFGEAKYDLKSRHAIVNIELMF